MQLANGVYPLKCSEGQVSVFKIDLNRDIEQSQLIDAKGGDILVFITRQGEQGGHGFAFPREVKGITAIRSGPGAITILAFVFDGTNAWPISNGFVNVI